MVSAIIVSDNYLPADEPNLQNLLEVLNSARILESILLYRESASNLPGHSNIKLVKTPDPASTAAIVAGIAASEAKELHGVIILPMSTRNISQAIMVNLLHRFWISHKSLLVAALEGKQQFLIIAANLFEEMGRSDGSLQDFVSRHAPDSIVADLADLDGMKKKATIVPASGDEEI